MVSKNASPMIMIRIETMSMGVANLPVWRTV
jgi:hypothetical protein